MAVAANQQGAVLASVSRLMPSTALELECTIYRLQGLLLGAAVRSL
jgi:hypothetical protein